MTSSDRIRSLVVYSNGKQILGVNPATIPLGFSLETITSSVVALLLREVQSGKQELAFELALTQFGHATLHVTSIYPMSEIRLCHLVP